MRRLAGTSGLGLNDAFAAAGGFRATTRQGLPVWTDARRPRRPTEPYPAWIAPDGTWAEGAGSRAEEVWWRDNYSAWGTDLGDYFMEGSTTASGYVCTSSCEHLAIAGQCWFGEDFRELHLGPLYEYALRPYRWQEAAVQAAYETASGGAVTASEVSALARVGRRIPKNDPTEEYAGTAEELERVGEIHEWDSAAASILAFGAGAIRPFEWLPGAWADAGMARPPAGARGWSGAVGPIGYGRPSPGVRNGGVQHVFYEEDTKDRFGFWKGGWTGQGFIAWRDRAGWEALIGASDVLFGDLEPEDWSRVVEAVRGADYREPAADAVAHRAGQCCDIRVWKTVFLTRGKWQRQGKPKEGKKFYRVECHWITGAAPAEPPGGWTTVGEC